MKRFLIGLLMLLPVLGFSQGNGGITNENTSTKIEWVGQNSGKYIVRVTNKQNCAADMRVQWGGNGSFRVKNIAANSSDTFWVSPNSSPNCFLGAKPETACSNSMEMGTVELNVCQALPVTFTSIVGQRVGPRSVKLIFTAEEDSQTKQYNIQYSLNGKTFETIKVLFPNGVVGGKQYSTIVNY